MATVAGSGRSSAPEATWPTSLWMAGVVATGCLAMLSLGMAHHSPLLDTLTPFSGHLWGASVAGALILVVARHRRLTFALCGLAILLAHSSVGVASAWLTRRDASAAAQDGSPFRIVLLNTWHSHRRHTDLEAFVLGTAADAIVLTETGPDKLALLDRLRHAYPHQLHCADQWPCALALLSKHPIESGAAFREGRHQPPVVVARLTPVGSETAITVVGTHVHRPTRNPYLHRTQMARLTSMIAAMPGPVIVAGDFNAVPWSASLKRLKAETGLKPHALMIPTWPATPFGLPQFAFDHVLLSSELTVRAADRGPAVGSDHYPVVVDLALPRRSQPAPSAPQKRRILNTLNSAASAYLLAQVATDLARKHDTP
jgi:endonuclease/exonuclease/phosphatase (EEP) superfamily protein YafD